jgi:hypothetical protein
MGSDPCQTPWGFMRTPAAIALFLLSPPLCWAQADAPVAQPEVKAGDRWAYRRMDANGYKPGETYEVRVTFAERNAIHVVITEIDGRESDATFTSEWNDVASPSGRINQRGRGELQFPLRTGATYRLAWEVENPRINMLSGYHQRTVKVVGWEEVVVPAGKFRALKVMSEGTHRPFGSNYTGPMSDVFWYVPEVKRWVKHVHESSRPRGNVTRRPNAYLEKSGEELIDFKVQ